MGNKTTDLTKFFVAGINYKKTDAAIRGQFAVSSEQYAAILGQAATLGLSELFILSTCNRTEIYGIAESAQQLIELLCEQTKGSKSTFIELSYIKEGPEAIRHLFSVAAGLDSQILGDYEIVGQIKLAVKFSKEQGFIQAFTERLYNAVLQASKSIKNHTGLSGGTVSVSFAAVQCIKNHYDSLAEKQILLIGTGKIGRNTCKNLVDYLDTRKITLINRSEDKAFTLAEEMGLRSVSYENANEEIAKADIIIVATNSEQPIIRKADLIHSGKKLLIDLSIPNNIETCIHSLPNMTLLNVDDLAKINDATLQMRQAEVPKANLIIDQHIVEFLDWHEMRRHVPLLRAVKTKLIEMHSSPLFGYSDTLTSPVTDPEAQIQRVINGMAIKMRSHNRRGCHYIEAINDFIAVRII